MPFDDKYFNSYAASLLELDIEDILSALPSSSQNGYYEFISNLILYVNNEIKSNEELRTESSDSEDIKFFDSELEKLNKIRTILVSKLDEIRKENGTPDEISKEKKNLIFLITNAGNPFIERDLKEIPREYKNDLVNLLESLESFGLEDGRFNDQFLKKFTGNDSLKGTFEIKTFKVRLYFMPIDSDSVLVLMAEFKNQTNPKSTHEALSKRVSMNINNSNKLTLVDDLKRKLANPEIKAKLIEEHALIKEDLLNKLRGNVK